MALEERLAYSTKTFAEAIEAHQNFVKEEIYRGNLRAVKRGGHWKIPVDAAREYLEKGEEAREGNQSVTTAAPTLACGD